MKKVISLFLVSIMLFSLSSIVYAETSTDVYRDVAKVVTYIANNDIEDCRIVASFIKNNMIHTKNVYEYLKLYFPTEYRESMNIKVSNNALKATNEVFKGNKDYLSKSVIGWCYIQDLWKAEQCFIDSVEVSRDKTKITEIVNKAKKDETVIYAYNQDRKMLYSNHIKARNNLVYIFYSVVEEKEVDIFINGKEMKKGFGEAFINSDDRTMIPLRAFVESMGFEVEWIGESQLINIMADGSIYGFDNNKYYTNVQFQIGNPDYYIDVLANGKWNYDPSEVNSIGKKTMDTIPVIIKDRTYIPLRYAAETFGYIVDFVDMGDSYRVNCTKN